MDRQRLEAASETFGSVFVVVQHLTRLTDDGLADWGLTTRQWLLLAVLVRGFPGRLPSLSEAAAAYGSSRQNVKQIALGLEARGWLRLEPDPGDARATRLVLTDKVALFDTADGRVRGEALLAAAFDGFTRDEVLALRDLVTRWLAVLASRGRGVPAAVGPTTAAAAATAAATAGASPIDPAPTHTSASRKGPSTP